MDINNKFFSIESDRLKTELGENSNKKIFNFHDYINIYQKVQKSMLVQEHKAMDNSCNKKYNLENAIQIDSSDYKIGDTWTYSEYNEDCLLRPITNCSMISDTVIGDKVYTILERNSPNLGTWPESKVLISKRHNKVYFYEKGQEYLLYDFTLNVGDTLYYFIPTNYSTYLLNEISFNHLSAPLRQGLIVTKIDSIYSVDGFPRKIFYTENSYDTEYGTQIGKIYDGLGSAFGFFGQSSFIADPCDEELHCFKGKTDQFYKDNFFCRPERIINTNYADYSKWSYTPWNLDFKEQLVSVESSLKEVKQDRICHSFTLFKDNLPNISSKIQINYSDSMVYFLEDNKFKILYDFRSKNIGDSVRYYLPKFSYQHDISSTHGSVKPDTAAYYYKVIGIKKVVTNEGLVLKKYEIENLETNNAACYTMGQAIIEHIGSTSGYFGKPCLQLTAGAPEYFRCFSSSVFNYNDIGRDCNLTNNADVDQHIFIYPNPASTRIIIDCMRPYTDVELINIDGSRRFMITSAPSEIDVSNLFNGIYIIKINNQNETIHLQKIVLLK